MIVSTILSTDAIVVRCWWGSSTILTFNKYTTVIPLIERRINDSIDELLEDMMNIEIVRGTGVRDEV